MTDQVESAADALAVAAEDMLKSLWRYRYDLPGDEGDWHANDRLRRLRRALKRYRAAKTEEAPHDCLAAVPAPFMGGSWAELAIPDVTTWRCGCGQEWVWQRGGWERLADAALDEKPARAEEGKTIGGSFHQHTLRHSHVGGDADHNHVQMAAEASDQTARVTAPRQFMEGIAPLLLLGYERLALGDLHVEDCRFDRAVLAASLTDAVTAVDAAARRLRAAWRNVGGDAANLEAEG